MDIKVVDSIERLLFYKSEWESILKEINSDNVFLELDWIMLWWKHFGDRHKLFVLVVVNYQEIIGICPLMATNKRIYKIIDFIGGRESSRMDFILRNESRQEALEYICNFLRNLKGRNIIKFHALSGKSESYAQLKEWFKTDRVPYVSSTTIRYLLSIRSNDFNTHFIQRFGKKSRETMNSKERKLKSLGKLAYEKVNKEGIRKVFEIHEKRWLRKIGNSSFSKGDTKEFYEKLVSDTSLVFNTSVDAITLNGKIISFIYGILYKDRYDFLRIAHDDDFCFLSPGELVFKRKVEECFSWKINVLDFGLGYEPYKAKWTDEYEDIFYLIFPSKNKIANLIFYMKFWIIAIMKNSIKNNKRIYGFIKYSLGKLKFLLSKDYLSGKITGIIKKIRQDGFLAYYAKNLRSLVQNTCGRKEYQILEKDLESMEMPYSNMYIKEASIDDLDALAEVMNQFQTKIIRRFAYNHKCYITLHNENIIYYCWINCSQIDIPEVGLKLSFGNNDVYIYDTFMKRKYEDENNYRSILMGIFSLLYRNNYKRCYITSDYCNKTIENEIYKEFFHPRYKILEKREFGTTKHIVTDLKLNDQDKKMIHGVAK